jgi:heme-degrading monooxygenase HmoA
MIIRLFRCRPLRIEFDGILRDTMIPDLLRLPGVVDVHVGRHGPDSIGERLVASIWESEAAMVAAMGSDVEASRFHPEHLEETTDRSVEVHPLAIAVRVDRPDDGHVMRLVRGRVRAAELDAYVDDARAGTLRDASTQQGPCALYLAALPPDRFVTLSVWTEWASIEASTGAGTQAPGVTRHAERLVELEVAHYEVVPR